MESMIIFSLTLGGSKVGGAKPASHRAVAEAGSTVRMSGAN